MNRTENRSKPDRYEFVLGPASFFDMPEILEGASLEIDIQSDGVVSSRARPGKRVRDLYGIGGGVFHRFDHCDILQRERLNRAGSAGPCQA